MIEICLNPDNDTIGGETFESMDSELSSSGLRDTQEMAIRTADKLLKVSYCTAPLPFARGIMCLFYYF